MPKTRILLCTNSGICASLSLQALLSNEEIEVVGIFLSQRVRTVGGPFLKDLGRMIRTSGLRHTFYLALGTTFFDLCRFPDVIPTVKRLAKRQGIPVFSSKDINSTFSKKWIKKSTPEILLSSYFNQKIDDETLLIPTHGSVNIHPSLLPQYKGVDPVFYYLLNNENSMGVTLHKIDSDFDTGEILCQQTMPVLKNRSAFWHTTELFRVGLNLFLQWLDKDIAQITKINADIKDTYDSWPNTSQAKQLGKRLYSSKDFYDQATRPFSKKNSL